jgi:DNA replication protein DnaC
MKQKDEERQQALFLKLCTLPPDTDDRTFENFKYGHSRDLKEAYDAALDVVSGKIKFLTLVSEVDRGKTHLAIAICRAWLDLKRVAKYVFVPLLLKDLKSGFHGEGENSYDYKLDFYMKVALLVLDDMGVENETNWVVQELETIIDYRYINGLPTVVTTNLSIPKLNAKYKSERITSRLKRVKNSQIVVIAAPEYFSLNKGQK